MQRTHGSQAPRDATGWHGQPFARMENVSRIAVLRPNAVGDFVFALPALHALKHAYPDAELVYVGKEWHAQFLHGRPGPVDRVLVMPPVPGVGAPVAMGAGQEPEAGGEPAERFLARMRDERFDIALQMFGGGRFSNPFLQTYANLIGISFAVGFLLRQSRFHLACLQGQSLLLHRPTRWNSPPCFSG